jgi:hypothetical protein
MAKKSKKQQAKKRQRSLERKRAKRRQAQARAARRPTGARALLHSFANWPLMECHVTRDWQVPGEIVQILVARRSSTGKIATGTFLVDLGCLGVKSAFASMFDSALEYRTKLRDGMMARQPLVPADLNLTAKIIRESVAYADSLGFKPDPDYRDALIVLGDADPDACDTPIPLGGEDGNPLFIAGPYDDVPKIMAQLEKAVGPGNFHFMAPVEMMPPDFFE